MVDILDSIHPVVENSRDVSIDSRRIDEFCETIKEEDLFPEQEPSSFILHERDLESRVDFSLVFNSINFCYWGDPKWTVEIDGQNLDGSTGLAAALRAALRRGYPLLSACYLKNMPASDLAEILKGNVEIPLFRERVAILNETGQVLANRYDGNFMGWLKRVDNDALRLVDVITCDLPSYHDSAMFEDNEVFFHKRAQLAVSDINESLRLSRESSLNNMDLLTAYADYKLPQVQRKKGILAYSRRLASTIDGMILIPKGSRYEVEIRGNCVWAVHLMVQALKPRFPEVVDADVDHLLWRLSQVKSPDDLPYHRTQTICY